jgi:hypothetical protein
MSAAHTEARVLVLELVRDAVVTTLAVLRDEWSMRSTGSVWQDREAVSRRVLEDVTDQFAQAPDPEGALERLLALVDETGRALIASRASNIDAVLERCRELAGKVDPLWPDATAQLLAMAVSIAQEEADRRQAAEAALTAPDPLSLAAHQALLGKEASHA